MSEDSQDLDYLLRYPYRYVIMSFVGKSYTDPINRQWAIFKNGVFDQWTKDENEATTWNHYQYRDAKAARDTIHAKSYVIFKS